MTFNDKMAAVLGFGVYNTGWTFGAHRTNRGFDTYIPGREPINLNLTTHSLFVYTGVIQMTIVGNNFAPLLRLIPAIGKQRGGYVTKHFVNKYYIPLATHYIKHLTIDLRDSQDHPIDFQSGVTTAVLHFRKKIDPKLRDFVEATR